MIFVLGALVALIAVSSLAIDVGLVWVARTQLQNAADSAALAGAANLIDTVGPTVTESLAKAASVELAAQNIALSNGSLALPTSDITIGEWDFATATFDSSVSPTDPNHINAVMVKARLDGVANGPVPAFFARVLGRSGFDVSANATAYIGYAGSSGPGEINLPIAIDCCKLRGANCESDYCTTVTTNPPNPCDLENLQNDGVTTVSCLQFAATGEQNACWTAFDGVNTSVNSNDMRDIVHDGSTVEIGGGEPIYVDNGSKASVIKELADRFYGNGKYSNQGSGIDRYEPKDGVADSWVAGLPVVECQDDANCAGGTPAMVVGFVCIEIREVRGAPDKLLRVRFLCPSDPLFDECDIGETTSGGYDFGVRADFPVLVQ